MRVVVKRMGALGRKVRPTHGREQKKTGTPAILGPPPGRGNGRSGWSTDRCVSEAKEKESGLNRITPFS